MSAVSSADSVPVDLQKPGEHKVDVPIICQLTRFGLRGGRHLPGFYRDYRRVTRDAQRLDVPGLLRSAFLIENRATCYSFSIWSQSPYLSAVVPSHVDVANRAFGRVALDQERGPEVWSTKWRLISVTNNLNWDGFDLRQVILENGARNGGI